MPNRYETPIKYKDGNDKEVRGKLFFELDPIELMDWTFTNPFEASELQANLGQLRDIEKEDSRDLTQDEVRTMLSVIKILADLSAGRPTDDGQYFIKDKNWTSSYAYKGFRMLLMTNPKEVNQFLVQLLDNDVMDKFSAAILESSAKTTTDTEEPKSDSGAVVAAKMAELERLRREVDDLSAN